MKFTTKLYLGFGFVLVLSIVILSSIISMLNQLNHDINIVVQERYEKVRLVTIVKYELNSISRDSRGLLANPPAELIPKFQDNMNQSMLKAKLALESLGKMEISKSTEELVLKLKSLFEVYENNQNKIESLRSAGKSNEANQLYWYESREVREQMLELIDQLQVSEEQEMDSELKRSDDSYYFAVKMTYIYMLIGLIFGVGVTLWVIRSISRSLNRITSVMSSVACAETDRLPRIEVTSKDEIGTISQVYNTMAQSLEEHISQVKELMDGAEKQSWLKTQVAEIATMYAGIENLQDLANLFITKITSMVGASYGVFYIKEGTGSDLRFRKLAAYAYHNQDIGVESFRLGERLVGQCAAENRMIMLSDVPDDYIKISSGIGMASPKHIVILPADLQGEVLAVVELASFETFSPLQQLLLDEVLSNIGITINSIMNHMQVQKLLQESQALTEELQSQSEELQMQQEELRTINEKLEEQYEHAEQKTRELEKISLILEEKAQQLAISSQYKSEFLANMSHELRTPLNSLLILAQILAENADGNLTHKQVEYANTIYASGNDLLKLINDILDLAKVEAGKLEVTPEDVRLSNVKLFVENQFLPIARQKGIQFDVQLAPDVPENIYTDEGRLQQILKNLLSNAFKFTEKGSVFLHIEKADQEALGEQRTGSEEKVIVAFSVTDTGIGVPKDKQSVIFEEFKQADGTTSRKYGGTGLGLSISRKIAELLGGSIDLDSVEGKGSTFTLYLPSHPQEMNSSDKEAAAALSQELSIISVPLIEITSSTNATLQPGKTMLEGKKILVVDDDMRNVFALTTALEGYEMEVVFAENGREAIAVLTENPDVDLILMDIMMPEMDGFEAMRIIRGLPQFEALPIIALTAKAMKHDREQCIEAGASDYISKPVNIEQLFSLMRVWLYR